MNYAKDVQEAVKRFRGNPYWREYYDGAVSARLQEWIGHQFLLSRDPECWDEVVAAMEQLENRFTVDEWEYVYKYTGNNPYRLRVQKRIERLRGKEE